MHVTRKTVPAGMLGCIPFSVLSAALPAAAQQVVNVDARVSGISSYDPGGTLYSPVSVSLAAGTYTLTAVTPSTDAQALFTSWSYNTPWVWQVYGFDAAQTGASGLLLNVYDGVNHADYDYTDVSYSSDAAAFASQGSAPVTFTLSKPTTMDFVVRDYGLYDNTGGVSFSLASAPEPSQAAGMLIGAFYLGVLVVRARRRAACTDFRGFR